MKAGTNRVQGRNSNYMDFNPDGGTVVVSGPSSISINTGTPIDENLTSEPSLTGEFVIPNPTLTTSSFTSVVDIVPTSSLQVTSSQVVVEEETIDLSTQFLPDVEEIFTSLFDDNISLSPEDFLNPGIIIRNEGLNISDTSTVSVKSSIKWSDLTSAQQARAKKFYKTATTKYDYTDLEAKAIISVIAKENAFEIKEAENLNYSATSIKAVFGDRTREIQTGSRKGQKVLLANWTDEELKWLAKNPVRIGNFIYGQDSNKYGPLNGVIVPISKVDDKNAEGYRYRGRSYGSITYKTTYKRYQDLYNKKYSKQTINVINNPGLLDDEKFAYDFVAFQYKNPPSSWSAASGGYNLTNSKDAVTYYVRLFGGWGSFSSKYTPKTSNRTGVRNIVKEGLDKALSFYQSIENLNFK